jgi:flagellar basal body rod protein FlgG
MSDIFSITGVGLLDGQRRLEAASLNAANASRPGYRRQVAAAAPVALSFDAVLGAGVVAAAPARGVDMRTGQLIATGRPLDVAIDGTEGFFGLSDGQRTWLTRAGSFRVDAEGYLVGEGGLRVQGPAGDLRLDSADVEIRPDGRIVREGVEVATLALWRAAAGAAPQPGRGTLLRAPAGVEPMAGAVRLRSGHVESSNATAHSEVLGLVALTRQYESLVRVTQGYDEVLGRAIQRLGDL